MAGKEWPSARTIAGLWLIFFVPADGLFWPFLQEVRPYDIRPNTNQALPNSDEIKPAFKKTDPLHQPSHLSSQESGASDQHHGHQHNGYQHPHHLPDSDIEQSYHRPDSGVQHPHHPPDSDIEQSYHRPDSGVQHPHHPPDSDIEQSYHRPDSGVQYPRHPPDSDIEQSYHRPDSGVQHPHHPPDSDIEQSYHRPDSGAQHPHHPPDSDIEQSYYRPDNGVQQTHHQPHSGVQQTYHQPDSSTQDQRHQLESGVHQPYQQTHMTESPRAYESASAQLDQRSHRTDGNRQQPYRETGSRYKRPYYQTGTERSHQQPQTESAAQRPQHRSSSHIKSAYGNVHHELQGTYPQIYGLHRDPYYRTNLYPQRSDRLPDSRLFHQSRGGWENTGDIVRDHYDNAEPVHYMKRQRLSGRRLYPHQRRGVTTRYSFGNSRDSVSDHNKDGDSEGSLHPRANTDLPKGSRDAVRPHGQRWIQSVHRSREVPQEREEDMSWGLGRSAQDPSSQKIQDVYLPEQGSPMTESFRSNQHVQRNERVDKMRRYRPHLMRGPSPMHELLGERVMKSSSNSQAVKDDYISARASSEGGISLDQEKRAHPDTKVSSSSNPGLRKRGYVFPQWPKYPRSNLRLNTPAEDSEPVDDVTKNPVEDLPYVSHKGGAEIPFRGTGLVDILTPSEKPTKHVPESRRPSPRRFKGILHYLSARHPNKGTADENPYKTQINLHRPFLHLPNQPSAHQDVTQPPETTEGVDPEGLRHYYNIPGRLVKLENLPIACFRTISLKSNPESCSARVKYKLVKKKGRKLKHKGPKRKLQLKTG